MKYIIFFLLLFLIGCTSYEGGLAKEFPPKQFCQDTGGDWRKVPKEPADPTQGIFDVDQHPDYNHQCICPEELSWTNNGCQ